MKRKVLSILLCASMALTMTPCFTTGAWAAAEEETPAEETAMKDDEPDISGSDRPSNEPVLAYVPLDNRPVNVDRVVYEAESAGFTVKMPDEDLYATRLDGQPRNSNGTQSGDSQKLLDWILEMDKSTDYFVISLDQLLSGGLVNSRVLINKKLSNKEKKLIDAIIDLSQDNHVYVIDTVARLATCTVGYQGATLETYNYLRDYSIKPRPVLKDAGLKTANIARYYARDDSYREINIGSTDTKAVANMLRTRERKLNLIDYILSKDTSGRIKYFIGIDDSSSQNTIQTNEINYIRKTMGDRGLIYSGTDELGMMAVLRLMIDHFGYNVNAATIYFGETERSGSGSAYDLETVRENVEKHLESIGVKRVEPEDADLEIVVLTAPSKNILNAKYINRMIDYINGNISKGIPTIVINSAPSVYSGNLEYRMIRECELSMLLAYSSWNTVGNSIGLALGNGISRYLYLNSRDNSSDRADVAFLKGLIFSYEKDISYQRGGGKELFNSYLASKGWSASNFYQDDEQVKTVYADLEDIFKTSDYNVTVDDIVDNLTGCRYFKGLSGECGIIGTIGLSNYSAPFFRTFEIRFDIDVELSDTTISGSGNAMKVTMPYAPADGQLTYSLNLYYMDASGKLHKIPSAYDKATGTISFITDSLPGFFTDALSMEAEKAYSLFTDVAESSWYFDDVMYIYEKGLMKGTTGSTFEPNAAMTRAMLAHTLYSMAGKPEAPGAADGYEAPEVAGGPATPQDLGNGWYRTAAEWALANDIIPVYKNGNFGPNDPVTREQLADILWRYAKYRGMDVGKGGYPGVYNYADVFAVPETLRDGFDWACSNGIIKGTDGGTLLKPQAGATRAEVAAVLKRFLEI
ncbi:MAG TPA: DUF4127 family protein [Anaerovoracaceae bacterium]|nr:DUF4127 family protein [Anaerovoracaceae bacterium]